VASSACLRPGAARAIEQAQRISWPLFSRCENMKQISPYVGNNPTHVPLRASTYTYDVWLKTECATYVVRYESSSDQPLPMFAPNRRIEVNPQKHVLCERVRRKRNKNESGRTPGYSCRPMRQTLTLHTSNNECAEALPNRWLLNGRSARPAFFSSLGAGRVPQRPCGHRTVCAGRLARLEDWNNKWSLSA
jgi:hypothetical protein